MGIHTTDILHIKQFITNITGRLKVHYVVLGKKCKLENATFTILMRMNKAILHAEIFI